MRVAAFHAERQIERLAVIHVRVREDEISHRRKVELVRQRVRVGIGRVVYEQVVVHERLAARAYIPSARGFGAFAVVAVAIDRGPAFRCGGAQISKLHKRAPYFFSSRSSQIVPISNAS